MAPTDLLQGHYFVIDGRFHVFNYRTVTHYGDTPWIFGMHFGSEIGGPVYRFWWTVAICAGALMLAVLVAALLGRRLSRPIGALAQASLRVARLDLAEVPHLGSSRVREIDRASTAFNAMVTGLRWTEVYLPRALLRQLLGRGNAAAAAITREQELTILFTDIIGFSRLAESLPASETAALLNRHFALIGECIEASGGTIDKFIGDSVMAVWGAPDQQPDHAARTHRGVIAIAGRIAAENEARRAAQQPAIRIRFGLHSGRALVGNIGFEGRINYTTVGDAVNVAQRIEQLGKTAGDGEDAIVLASGEFVNASGDSGGFAALGTYAVPGRDAQISVYRLLLAG